MVGVLFCTLSFRTWVLEKMPYSLCVLESTSSHQTGKEYGDNLCAGVCMGKPEVLYLPSAEISQDKA